MSKVKAPLVAGPGILNWINITGEGKEDLQGNMKYSGEVEFTQDDPVYAEAKAKIDAFWNENKPAGFKKKPKSNGIYLTEPMLDEAGEQVYNDDGEKVFNPEGKVGIRFKTGTTYTDGNQVKIPVHNAKGAKVNMGERRIGNGSFGSIQGTMAIYTVAGPAGKILDAGVTLYLGKVQVRKLVEYSGDESLFDSHDDDEGSFTGFDDDNFEGGTEDGTTGGSSQARL